MGDQLHGKVAIVTGAGKGIGAAIARAFGEEGATVIISDIDYASAKHAAETIPRSLAIGCDVTRPEQVQALVDETIDRFGRLDIMVPNAGIAKLALLAEMSFEEWRSVMAVNLDGVFLCIRYAAPAMIKAGAGAIVTICSITAQAGSPLIGNYSAAKAAVMSLTQTASVELRGHGIRVNAILPGFIETDMVMAGKPIFESKLGLPSFDALIKQRQGAYGKPENVARLAVFLASERSRFSTGSGYVADGGVRASLL